MNLELSFIEASLRLNVMLEKSTWNALRSLGLQASYDGVALAEKEMRDESPLYIKTIVLRGQMCQDMYDDHPGFAYFYTDASQSIEAPPYCTLSKAMQLSLQMLAKAQQESEQEEEYDGLFSPDSIILLDQFDNTVHEYARHYRGEGRCIAIWLESLPPKEDWHGMEEEAKALDSEGSFEIGWDNFSTGRQLHAQADSLRRKIEMAKAHSRLMN